MPVAHRLLAAALLALAAPTAPAQSPATPPDARRVRVLIAAETSDPGMVPMVQKDVDTFKRFLGDHLPERLVTVDELTGPGLTASAVVAYYRKLDVRPTDALVFYYTGHGSFRENGAADVHTLEFQVRMPAGKGRDVVLSKQAMARPELKREMLAKKAALAVVLTDCCSDHINVPPPKDHRPGRTKALVPWAKEPTPVGRALFLRAAGEVDLTAASKGQAAVCDSLVGSYFTVALRRAAAQKTRPVDWASYVARVKAETQQVTEEEAKKPGLEEVAKSVREKKIQMPQAFVVKTSVPTDGYAAVALDNATGGPVKIQVRWAGTDKWATVTVANGQLLIASAPQAAGRPTNLQVMIGGQVTALPARLVTAKPNKANALDIAAVYELPSLKPAGKSAGRTRGLVELPDDPPPR